VTRVNLFLTQPQCIVATTVSRVSGESAATRRIVGIELGVAGGGAAYEKTFAR
jgi:hypothetical protein